MLKGLIIINAYSKLARSINQASRLKEEFSKLDVQIDILPNDAFLAAIVKGDVVSRDDIALIKVSSVLLYDFIIYLDKDKYMSQMLTKLGCRLFNSANAIATCDDKMLTHIALANCGIDMPKTLSGLLCYDVDSVIEERTIDKVEDCLSYPLIVKESYGSLGKGVYLVNDREQLRQKMQQLKMIPHLFQQYIATSFGRDVRVIVIGGKVFASMKRQSNGDFRSNIELGGVGTVIALPASFVKMSEQVAKVLELDYCGIDILFGEDEQPILCEVNSNAFFGGIERVVGCNVAKAYAEYIIDKVKKRA